MKFYCFAILRQVIGAVLSYSFMLASASPLSDAFSMAKSVDEAYLSALANFGASQEYVELAKAPLLPSLSLNTQSTDNQLNKNEGFRDLPQQNYRSSSKTIILKQPIIRLSNWVQFKQSSLQASGAKYELARAENDLASRVVSAYLDTLLADEQMSVIADQIKSLRTQLIAATQGLENGFGTQTDVIEVQSRLDQAKADEQQIRSAKLFAIEQLKLFSGYAGPSILKSLNLNGLNDKSIEPLEIWLEKASRLNPEILFGQMRLEIAQQEILKIKAGHLPTVDLIAQVSNSNNENIQYPATVFTNRQIGFQFNLPLYSGGSVLSSSRQAMLFAQKEERALNAMTNNIRLQVLKEFNNFIDGIERTKAHDSALTSAEQYLRSTEKNKTAGYKTRMDVMNAQQKILLVKKDQLITRFQCLLALMKLQLISGESAEQSLNYISTLIK